LSISTGPLKGSSIEVESRHVEAKFEECVSALFEACGSVLFLVLKNNIRWIVISASKLSAVAAFEVGLFDAQFDSDGEDFLEQFSSRSLLQLIMKIQLDSFFVSILDDQGDA